MKLLILALAAGLAVAPRAAGASESKVATALQLRPKAALAAAVTHNSAPFVVPAAEPELDLLPRRDTRLEESRSACNGERALCYDQTSGRIVYRPARMLMPEFPGLKRENISVKRDRILLRYSFR